MNHTARTLEAGETEWVFGAGMTVIETGEAPMPSMLVSARHGFTDSVDAGLTVTEALSVQGDVNICFYDSEDLALSFNPSLSHFFIVDDLASTFLWLPILADVYSTDDLDVTLIGRWGQARISGLDDDFFDFAGSTDFASLGVGARWDISPEWTLLPEFHLMRPIGDNIEGLWMATFSMSFVF